MVINTRFLKKRLSRKKWATVLKNIKCKKKNWVKIKADKYRDKIKELYDVLLKIIKEQRKVENFFCFNYF